MAYPNEASLLNFLNNSPCNFLAVYSIQKELEENGFTELDLTESWNIQAGGKYFVKKNDSAIFAFKIGCQPISKTGFKIVSAHSDSPCFRIKPNPIMLNDGVIRLNTEVYGGPILYTWFDRPLSIAGRVIVKGENILNPETRLIHIKKPLMVIPHLAIHFNRTVNDGNKLSKQKDMLPIIGIVNDTFEKDNFILDMISKELGINKNDILDFDLLLYNCQKAETVGTNGELFMSGRIDDLSMAHAATTALLNCTDTTTTQVIAIFDNEETGSGTKQGAASPLFANVLHRISMALGDDQETFYRTIEKSFMISADNAHAAHPNYPEKYDPTNHPTMGGGPVIKINANCKYMTDANSSAIFIGICNKAKVPYQYFVNHSDNAGGSTLGNILTSQIDICGVDVGNPIWAMHSAMETGSLFDHECMIKTFICFFNE